MGYLPIMILAVLLVQLSGALPVAATEQPPTTLKSGTHARRLTERLPHYPEKAIQDGREGWAQISFVIDPEGAVGEPILEDSSGGRDFERAAMRSIQGWRYEPATLNGEPVEQCHAEVLITFQLDDRREDRGASRKFIRGFKKTQKMLEGGNLDEARTAIEELNARRDVNLYESSRIWILRAMLAEKEGDAEEQLSSLSRAVVSDGAFVEERIHGQLLLMILALEIQQQKYGEAMLTYEQIEVLEEKPSIPDSLKRAMEDVKERTASGVPFAVNAKIGVADEDHGGAGVWRYKPAGRMPGIGEVDGELERFELRCEWHRAVGEPESGKAWRIPEEWGDCWMYVFGHPGSKFQLIEYSASGDW